MRFVDEATITIRSGKGGNGCASFRRERYIPRGGPDGGDGGKGGDVIFRGSDKLMTLYDFRLKRIYTSKNGLPGMGKDRYGRAADDLVVDLPVGTLIYEITEDKNNEPHEELIADLVDHGHEVLICQGGNGGRGNIHFKTSTNRTPRQFEEGWPGQERKLRLELKILADAGLLGLPNAGKSTFIAQVSAARPKIGAYPFTTLTPNLGVLERKPWERMIIADIPGLIEGASQGMGLGHTFLKHVERTRLLVHILSAEELVTDGGNPFAGFELLNDELKQFDATLGEKPQLMVINKIDLLTEERLAELKNAAKQAGLEIMFMSALNGVGVQKVVDKLWDHYHALDSEE